MSSTVKEYTSDERAKIGKNVGVVGIIVNLILFAMKVTVGIISSSVSIIADAVNNLSDAGSSILVMVGYIFSVKPADKKHPYGHARLEYLCTLFISVIVTVLGIELLISSIESITSGGDGAAYGTVSIVIMCASIALKLFLAVFFRIFGKKISSASLQASSVDSLGDVAATTAVIVGMFLTPVFGGATDGVLGCVIAGYILILGVKLIKEASDTLLGTAPDSDLVLEIISKLKSYEGVLGIHDLVMHNYGEGRFFASVHLEVDSDVDIMLSHDRIDNIENDFAREMGIHLVIHLDPVCVSNEKVNALRESVHRIIDSIAGGLGDPISMHDFRAVFGITHTNLIFDVVVSHDLSVSEETLCKMIKDDIAKIDPSYNAVITVDRDYTSTIY